MSIVGYWKLDDDAANTTVVDTMGTYNGAAQQNTQDITVAGKIGTALSFNGSTDYIALADTLNTIISDSYSFTMWIKPDDGHVAGTAHYFGSRNVTNTMWLQFSITPAGRINYFMIISGKYVEVETEDVIFEDGAASDWVHLAVTIDNTAKRVIIYIDGKPAVLQAAKDGFWSDMVLGNWSATDNLYLGAQNYNGTSRGPINGGLDDTILYDEALTEQQVRDVYKASKVAHWKLDDNEATTTVVDYVAAHNNNGTALNNTNGLTLPGIVNKALKVDASDYVDLGSHADIDNIWDGGGTLCFWVRFDAFMAATATRLFSKAQWELISETIDQKLSISVSFDGSGATWDSDNGVLKIGEWVHIAVVYDSDSDSNAPMFYINGISINVNVAAAANGSRISDAASNLWMGNRAAGGRQVEGAMDDAIVFNYAMSGSDIVELYQRTGGRIHSGEK